VTRVLVTGASGFVGRHVTQDLSQRGFEVHGVTRQAMTSLSDNVIWHECDLLAGDVAGVPFGAIAPDALVHLAWVTTPGSYWSCPSNELWVESSVALLKAFARAGGTRAVFAGTCAEYTWGGGTCHEETSPLVPATPYGIAKHRTNLMCDRESSRLGVSFAWARLFGAYGAHEHPGRLVPAIIRSLLCRAPVALSHGEQLRDYLHASEVASAISATLVSDVCGAVNIASGRPTTLRHLAYQIANSMDGVELLRFGQRAAPANEPLELTADTDRLNLAVGWRPRKRPEDTIKQTIDWWRTQDESFCVPRA
jgi:nucleoside-diphosphate-sugar epimerase